MKPTAFYSDPHFGHANIIKYCSRPFRDIDEMTSELVTRYNDKISSDDLVIWLGDCAMGSANVASSRLKEILPYMNGKKFLIRGNHDHAAHVYLDVGFEGVVDELNIHINGRLCKLNHFPYAAHPQFEQPDRFAARRPQWQHQDQVLIHGHSHSSNRLDVATKSINVSVEAWDYAPAMTYDVIALLKEL